MNVFRRGKKTKDKENVDPFADEAANETTTSKMSRSLKRKNKNVPEPKLEFNLAAALPASNDFRTSLLMPGLSARFSMLKEQDDPNSLLGKASDDSVLFPKRASRMNLFGHNPLADIAETESLHSIPKPFARDERTMSISDGGYASDDGGNVMGRSRPGEGNNLFGGRQKVYRVAGGQSGQGRHLYDDDVAQPPYQQWRAAKSRDEDLKPESDSRSESAPRVSEETDHVHSPMTAFSKNRGTTSSTMSGPSNRRTSTAATSVATCESPIPRQNSGHGATSRLRTSDGSDGPPVSRNVSSNSRKDFAAREPTSQPPMPSASPIGPKLSQSRSAVNLKERYGAPSPVFSTHAYRANSPPPPVQAIPPMQSGVQESSKGASMHSRRYQTASPTQQTFEEDGDSVYSSNVHANDRGKATAMGLFNRPRQQFDEQQYLQRQRQMHEGRSSPMVADTPERVASPDARPSAMSRIEEAASALSTHQSNDRQSHDSHSANTFQPSYGRNTRNVSAPVKSDDNGERMRTKSTASSGSGQPNVKARVESLIRRQNAELNAMEAVRPPMSPPQPERQASTGTQSSNKMPHSPFLNRFDSSDDEEVEEAAEDAERPSTRFSRPTLAPDEVHPALRNGLHDFDFGEQVSPRLPKTMSIGSQNASSFKVTAAGAPPNPSKPSEDDSPTLGPNGLGLSGMIRTHLRHDSDRSSFYPPSPATENFQLSRTSREMSMHSTSNTINPPESVHSDPWEYDNAQRNSRKSPRKTSEPLPSSAPTMSQKAQQILGHAAAQRAQGTPGGKAQQILGNEAPNSSAESITSPQWPANSSNETVNPRAWQEDQQGHHRNASTETQKERQDFDAQLAERRRRIQEGLKGVAERDRSMSPGPGRMSNEQRHQPFPNLRHKTSKGTVGTGDYSQKAMKMLGLNGGPAPEHQRPPPRQYNSSDNEYDEPPRDRQWGRGPVHRPPPAKSQGYNNASGRRTPHDGHSNGRRTPADGRTTPHGNSSNEDFERARQQSTTPNSSRGYGRDRAGSQAAERSKSRTRQYRDDEGHGPSPPRADHSRTPDESRRGPGYERSSSAMSGNRARSNSRPGPPPLGHFDGRGAPPTPVMNGPSPGLGHRPSQDREGMMAPPIAPGPGSSSAAIGAPRASPRPPMGPSSVGGLGLPSSPMPSPFPGMPSPAVSSISALPPSPAPPQGPLPSIPAGGRTTPGADSGRTTPGGTRRRMTVNKNMISEPTFISSTSSVPLVGLPNAPFLSNGGNNSTPNLGTTETPPLPAMNPRRRGGAESPALGLVAPPPPGPYGGSHSAQPSPSFGMPATFAASGALDPGPAPQGPPPRARHRLRKISSEGGNMASKARQQAFAAEMHSEQARTPTIAAFQGQTFTRSQTTVRMSEHDGGMF